MSKVIVGIHQGSALSPFWSPMQSIPKLQQGIQSTLAVYVPLVLVLTPSYALRVIYEFIINVQK